MKTTVALLVAAALLPGVSLAQTAKPAQPAAKPAAAPSLAQVDILNVQKMSEAERAVVCVSTLRVLGSAATNKDVGAELTATADRFRDYAVKNGIDQAKGDALMKRIGSTFEANRNKPTLMQSLQFYGGNCMQTAYKMGMTKMDITASARPAPATAKPAAPKK